MTHQQNLAASNLPLALHIAKSFARSTSAPLDELQGEALLALARAASEFDDSRGVPFGAWAAILIRRHFITVVDRWIRTARRCRSFSSLSDVLPFEQAAEQEESDCERREAEEAARRAVERLREEMPERWFAAIWQHHGKGLTLKDVGEQLGVSRERARQLVWKGERRAMEPAHSASRGADAPVSSSNS